MEEENGISSYKAQVQSDMLIFCREEILNYFPEENLFLCHYAL